MTRTVRIEATTDDGAAKIAGTLRIAPDSDTLVILLHGFSSSQTNSTNSALFSAIAARGFTSLAFDFRGCGESSGSLGSTTISTGLLDARAVLSAAERQNGQSFAQLRAIGSSFGGAVAVALAQEREVRSLGLKAPMLDIEAAQRYRRSRSEMEQWEHDGSLPIDTSQGTVSVSWDYVSDSRRFDLFSPALLRRSDALAFVAHGTEDEVVPLEQSRDFVSRAPDTRTLCPVDGARHKFDEAQHSRVVQALLLSLDT